MVHRIYVEKKQGFRGEALALWHEIVRQLGISSLTGLRVMNRYDVEGVSFKALEDVKRTVFAEPQVDDVSDVLDTAGADALFIVQALPGQFDQRADSAEQCIQLLTGKERPTVRSAKVYLLFGKVSKEDVERIKRYIINPVETREVGRAMPATLQMEAADIAPVEDVPGFLTRTGQELDELRRDMGLAMDLDDLLFVQRHFISLKRNPTVTEIRVMDTYWSDHCRHTTFLTELEQVDIADPYIRGVYEDYLRDLAALKPGSPVTLMSLATLAAKKLKKQGVLLHLDESEEINACTVKIKATTEQGEEDWLLLFKNETHNHPTEIEPFGGAATCIGGAIRDPLSARAYVYAAMRVSGAGDPTTPIEQTLRGKLPQRKICQGAWAGFSSYGNQIGLATGLVKEMYHSGYTAKRLEAGAVLGAAPCGNVRRERPVPGDKVILLGGRTGRDGIGGATGSSKAHVVASVDTCASQVQKGNAPEERKLQRLFLNPQATRMIKRCNDFGAGGVSVAVGELADGLDIELDKVPVKYLGLNGTELAISESQERMAVVVEAKDVDAFLALAAEENLEATVIATVLRDARMVMRYRGQTVVDLARDFLNSNGAKKRQTVSADVAASYRAAVPSSFFEGLKGFIASLQGCSTQGMSERFDATIGAGSVLMPFGGKYQKTPPCAMVHTLPKAGMRTASYMAYAAMPHIAEVNPYQGAYFAVVESLANLVAAGGGDEHAYLSFQEFFARPNQDPKRWAQPLLALLGAYRAQLDYQAAAIGGKDSMSGTFEHMDVPPTFISFAVTWGDKRHAMSPEFKGENHRVLLLAPEVDENGLPVPRSVKENFRIVNRLIRDGRAASVSAVGEGGAAYRVFLNCLGNGIGFQFAKGAKLKDVFAHMPGTFLVEIQDDNMLTGQVLGYTVRRPVLQFDDTVYPLDALQAEYEAPLEAIYPTRAVQSSEKVTPITYDKASRQGAGGVKPRVLIPVFPGTNCELDTARAFERVGAQVRVLPLRNLTAADIDAAVAAVAQALEQTQILMLPGGFSGGDEPDGSAKMMTAFFRNPLIMDRVHALLDKQDGLIGGICNGFQALIKLGLIEEGRIINTHAFSPTLTHNLIGRHQSRLVRVRLTGNHSPWLHLDTAGSIRTLPISHGEGRFVCDSQTARKLIDRGQIATQYVDLNGDPTMDIAFNPAGSTYAVEGLLSPDGRVFGRMGHAERMVEGLYRNVLHAEPDPMFASAVRYYE